VIAVRLHPLADRVDDAIDGRLRRRDQFAHLDPPFRSRESPTCARGLDHLGFGAMRSLAALHGLHCPAREAQPRGDELIGSCCPSHTPVGEDEHLGGERLAFGDREPSRAASAHVGHVDRPYTDGFLPRSMRRSHRRRSGH
jgi:hypothetical protein